MIKQVALVSEVKSVSTTSLTRVAAALQKQVMRDFGPIWSVTASVDAFDKLEDVPLGYWPLIVVADVKNAAGVHLDNNGQPFALVEFGPSWSLTASHECLEMLADPFGNRLVAGQSPKKGQGRVEFLVEVCDPSEDEAFAYHCNNVLVSDFYTPRYFEPTKTTGVRYSFTGAITEPRQVLSGGYLSWHDPTSNHWFQQTFFGTKSSFRDIGVLAHDGRSLREQIDTLTPQTKRLSHLGADSKLLTATADSLEMAETATGARASAWRAQISTLKKAAKPIES
ncbi:MAG: hypothetical protein ACXV8R_03240 [Acidimicrobiia bacterium]